MDAETRRDLRVAIVSEAAYQDEQYDKSMGIGIFDPAMGLMICTNVQCRNIWPTDFTADQAGKPVAIPTTPDCPVCCCDGRLLTNHKVTA